jgi:hypothetical protein
LALPLADRDTSARAALDQLDAAKDGGAKTLVRAAALACP